MLSSYREKKLSYLFKLYDSNKNGFLQLDDFSIVARKICDKLEYAKGGRKEEELKSKARLFFDRLLEDTERTAEKEIELSDWLGLFEGIGDNDDVLDDYVELIIGYLFDLFDINHDGYISIEEYRDIFDIYGIDQLFVVKAFNNLDINGDQRLSKQELNSAVETFLTSDDPLMKGNWIFGSWDSDISEPV